MYQRVRRIIHVFYLLIYFDKMHTCACIYVFARQININRCMYARRIDMSMSAQVHIHMKISKGKSISTVWVPLCAANCAR